MSSNQPSHPLVHSANQSELSHVLAHAAIYFGVFFAAFAEVIGTGGNKLTKELIAAGIAAGIRGVVAAFHH